MTARDRTHDPAASSWVEGADAHPDFPVQNLPLAIARLPDGPRGVMAIGDFALDLVALRPLLAGDAADAAGCAGEGRLNLLFADGTALADALRHEVFDLLTDAQSADAVRPHLHPQDGLAFDLPFAIGDYTDFYAGIHHAENVGRLFRPDNPLLPNYKHVPVGYHGRASSVRVSGTPVARPHGQRLPGGGVSPVFGPTERLDYELEMAIWIAGANPLGTAVAIGEAEARIAGLGLLNDWSARDIQAWEYQPLGPFLAKNFMTSVSPWLVTSAALAPFRIAQPPRGQGDPAPMDYLAEPAGAAGAFAVTLETRLLTRSMRAAGDAPLRLSRGPMASLYWTAAQLIAHHSVGGCDLNPGDLIGTGTISGPDIASAGSLMEITANGSRPLSLPDGGMRQFLEPGDEIILTARAEAPGARSIGFGTCCGVVG